MILSATAVIPAQEPPVKAKQHRLAVKVLSRVPDLSPARYPHLMRELCGRQRRGMDASVQGVTDRILRWVSIYYSILHQVGVGAQPENSLEGFTHYN